MTKFCYRLMMLSFLITGTIKLSAQQNSPPLVPYWVEQDSLFRHLSKNNIQVLYDRVHQWANLHHFNAQADSLSYQYLMQAWHELYLATYNRGQLMTSGEVRQRVITNKAEGKGITVGYIDYEFHNIAPYAEDSGYIVKNQQSGWYYDGVTPQKAYLVNRSSLPVIAADEIKAGMQKFYFDPDVKMVSGKFLNQSVTITIRSGNQNIVLAPGQTKNLNIVNGPSGRPSISLDISITPGIVHTFPWYLFAEPGTFSSVTTYECNSGDTPQVIWSGPSLKFKGYNEATATEGKGEYKVFYKMNSTAPGDCIDNKITKPIIVIDGFDPQNANQEHPNDIWNLLSYGSSKHFGDDLRVEGYDVVVLNFPRYRDVSRGIYSRDGGADYIERNAMVLIALINKVKQELISNGSSEEIVIIGPSMGGQIARYALKYMEDHGMNHNTRLFIAFDSPNHGANIPIGLQMAIFYAGYYLDKEDALDKYNTKLASVAARQMLIHQLGISYLPFMGWTFPVITNSEPFHNTWQGNIDAMGYPDGLRKVALVNGNNSGQYKTSGSLMMHYNVYDVATGISLGNLADMKTWHLPSSGSFEAFYFKKKFKSPYSYTYNNTTPYGNIDAAPGGTYNAARQVKEGLDLGHFPVSSLIWGLIDVVGNGTLPYYSGDRHCFMPIASTLGFKNPAFNWATLNINNRNLVCEGAIDFDNYFTEVDQYYKSAANNGDHVRINERSARWAMEEIRYGKDGCPNICATKIEQVGGDRFLCPGVNFTFKLDVNVPAGATTTWEVSSGLIIVSYSNNQVVVRSTGGTTAYHRFLKATIVPKMAGAQCGASKIIFKEGLQYGAIFKYENMTHPVDTNYFITKVVPNLPGALYSWKADASSPWGPLLSGYQRDYLKIPYDAPTKYYYTRIYIPECSSLIPVEQLTGEYGRHGFEYSGGGEVRMDTILEPASIRSFRLVPNPTAQDWEVIIPEEFADDDLTIHIYSMDGRKAGSLQSQGTEVVRIPAAHLLPGNYIIEIIAGREKFVLRGLKQ